MIDIHTHLLPNVDDGVRSLEEFVKTIERFKSEGVTEVLCTPHFKKSISIVNQNELIKKFEYCKTISSELGINIHLSREVYIDEDHIRLLENSDVLRTHVLLIEFDPNREPSEYVLNEMEYLFELEGNRVVIAHIERYKWLKQSHIKRFKSNGYYIQMNTKSIISNQNFIKRMKRLNFIKNGHIDVLATDFHSLDRDYATLAETYSYIKRKLSKEVADNLIFDKPKQILKEK